MSAHARLALPAGFVLGYVRTLPYGKDSMTAHFSPIRFMAAGYARRFVVGARFAARQVRFGAAR
ncbi:hypothetical protein BCAR13_260071 [Paraburkholderia caribensis]|nr:hypothetical protein BCAR13_260071 [Paraburkholderia caribensis]